MTIKKWFFVSLLLTATLLASGSVYAAPLYFPHVDTSLPWQTEIAVINTSDQTVTGTLRGISNAGQLVETMPVTLSAHGRRQITVANEFMNHINIGYIIFDTDSTAVQGYTKFYQAGKYRAAIPAVKEVNTSDIYISHIDAGAQWWTGVSLVNTTAATKNLTMTYNNGQTRNITLNANEHQAFMIETQPDIQSAVITNASGVIGLELFGNIGGSDHLEGILLTDKTASTLYYPHVENNGWWTGVVAYNPSASACTITITPYSAQGTALTPSTRTIAGREKYIGLVSDLNLPAQTAWFRIGSTSPLSGFELFSTLDGNQLAAYAGGGGTGAKTGVFAKIEKNGGWTGIAFVNTEESVASVTLTAYNDNGTAVATQALSVGGYAKVVDQAANIFSQDISGATYIAYSSDRNVVGFQLNGSSDGTMLDGLPGLVLDTLVNLEGILFFDLNGSGLKEEGEPPIDNFKVCIKSKEICVDTNENGKFIFSKIATDGELVNITLDDPNAITPALAFRYINLWKKPIIIPAYTINGVQVPEQSLNDVDIRPIKSIITLKVGEGNEIGLMQGLVTLPFYHHQFEDIPFIEGYFDIIGNRIFTNTTVYNDTKDGIMLSFDGKYNSPGDQYIPRTGVSDSHTGVDYLLPIGNYIVSTFPTSKAWFIHRYDDNNELRVDLMFQDPDDPSLNYNVSNGHLGIALVQTDQLVYRGQIVALSGNSGDQVGPTRTPGLHFGIARVTQEGWWYLDPYRYTIKLDPLPKNFWGSEVSWWTKDNDPQFPLIQLNK